MLLLKDCMPKAPETQEEDGDEGVKVDLQIGSHFSLFLLLDYRT